MTRQINPNPAGIAWAGSLAATCAAALSNYDLAGKDIVVSLPSDVIEAVQVSGVAVGGALAAACASNPPSDGGALFIFGNGKKIVAPAGVVVPGPLVLTGGARVTLMDVELIARDGSGAAVFIQKSQLLVGSNVILTAEPPAAGATAVNALLHAEAFGLVEIAGTNTTLKLQGITACGFEIQDKAYLEFDPAVGVGLDGGGFDFADPNAYGAGLFRVMTDGLVGAIHLDWSKFPGKGRPYDWNQRGLIRGCADAVAAGWVVRDPATIAFAGVTGEF